MPDIYNVDPLKKFMCLMVGPNGSGKSIAIASWKQLGSIYYFDFDGRMASVANWYKQRGLKEGQLTFDTYGPENLYEAYQKMSSFVDRCPHAAIVIDSFTAMTVSAVMFSLRQRSMKGGKDTPAISKGNMILPDFDEYKGETVFVTQFLDMSKAVASQGTAVFWTAHPVQSLKIEGKNYSIQTKYSAYGNKSDSLIPIYFNEIYSFITDWDLQTQSNKRICHTQPHDGVNAKTALNLPTSFDWTDKDFYTTFKSLADEGQAEAMRKGEEYNKLNPTIEIKPEEKQPFKF